MISSFFLWRIPIPPNRSFQINVVKRLAEGLLFFCLISMGDRFCWDVGSWILSSNHLFHFIRKSIRNSPTNPKNQIIKKWRIIVHNHFACVFVYSFIYSLIVTPRIPGRDIQKKKICGRLWFGWPNSLGVIFYPGYQRHHQGQYFKKTTLGNHRTNKTSHATSPLNSFTWTNM